MSRGASFCTRCGGSLVQRYVEGRERQACSRCGRIHYYTLNIHYLAEVVSGEPRPASDALELAWFAPHELPSDLAFRSSYQALEGWQRVMQGEFTPMALISGNPVSGILNLGKPIEVFACIAIVWCTFAKADQSGYNGYV